MSATTFGRLMNAEWTKLRSLRSSVWTLAAMLVVSVGLAAIISGETAAHWSSMSASDRATWDPTNTSLTGIALGQLAIAVFGVLAITSEYASGTIRASVMAVPRRTPMFAAKAAVYGGVALLFGLLISFLGFFVGQAFFTGKVPDASIGDPGVLRAILLTGVYVAGVSLIALGLGGILRHTAGAIAAIVAFLLVVPAIVSSLPGSLSDTIGEYLPGQLAGGSLAAVVPEANSLSPWTALAVLVGYVAVAMTGAIVLLRRRDV
jgi:hypothetical protein